MVCVNEQLKSYSQIDDLFDAAMLVGVEDTHIVYKWREQAEKERRD